ncbi:hypothetical protein [Hymenobacter sp. CRA2]|uniref:hypothetical protein n=1 Tax=Hymenobacter sp. CRA2 TaxID=1955620 RepID=UPI001117382D|nr:hypothetical protein [Hymenobacter sp. CRA2]
MGTYQAQKNKPKATDSHDYTNASLEEYINAVGSHEGTHVLDDVVVNKATEQNCQGCSDDELEGKKYVNREENADRAYDAARKDYKQKTAGNE